MSTLLDPPRYPDRNGYRWGECGIEPLRDLERWVQGGVFHPYGVKTWDRGPTIEEALEAIRENPGVLKFTGELLDYRRTTEYWIEWRQAGDPDSFGFGGPYPSPEDAAYRALTLIEQGERELFEQTLVVGLA